MPDINDKFVIMNFTGRPHKILAAVLLFATILFFSCRPEHSGDLTPAEEEQANLASSQSDAEAETVFNGIFDDAFGVNNDAGIQGTGIFGSSLPPCLNITIFHLTV